GFVILDDVDIIAVGPALHRGRRHDNYAPQRVDQQAHVDELARPKLQLFVREFGFELHGASGLVNLVVEHRYPASVERPSVGRERLDRQLSFSHSTGQFGQPLLRQIEEDGYWLQLCDDHEAGRIRGAYDIAFVDQADAGAARNGRHDVGIGEDGPRIVDG